MLKDNAELRVIDDLRAEVLRRSVGERLPSVRELMARHRAGPATVQRALAALAAEGLVETVSGRGSFVARDEASPAGADEPVADLSWQALALGARRVDPGGLEELLAIPRPGTAVLSSGFPDASLQPTGALGAALARAGRRSAAWNRLPVEGATELRAWFARASGGALGPHDVVVCPGGQSALSVALRALAAPGDPVLVESPTYLGALAAARAAGLRCIPVPTDADGVRPDLLERALAATGARLVVLVPTFANPTGAVLAPERRGEVLRAVQEADAFLVEDDWARDLAIDGDPPPPLVAADPHGHVVYIRSLTKGAAPGLRVAAVAARGPAGARLRAARIIEDFFVAGPLQEAALDLVSSPAWRRHRRSLAAALRSRRDALVRAVREHLPSVRLTLVPAGGLHLWVALPDGADDVRIAADAAAAGVVVMPGRQWFAAEPPGAFLRLSFAGAREDELVEGVRRLATVV
jgi:DNA-binding transcriptional MocR family regulator